MCRALFCTRGGFLDTRHGLCSACRRLFGGQRSLLGGCRRFSGRRAQLSFDAIAKLKQVFSRIFSKRRRGSWTEVNRSAT